MSLHGLRERLGRRKLSEVSLSRADFPNLPPRGSEIQRNTIPGGAGRGECNPKWKETSGMWTEVGSSPQTEG